MTRSGFFSVGQGDATLIYTRSGQSILIDCGPPNSGWDVILPSLDALGIRQIDLLVITHSHNDHAGGCSELLKSGRVKALAWPEFSAEGKKTTGGKDDTTNSLRQIASEEGVEMQVLSKNDTIRLKSGFDFLHVLSPQLISDPDDSNEQALHFRLEIQGQKVLLMSDCTAGIENALLAENLISPAQVLKVAHHGSRMTTRQKFLAAARPMLAVISVGYNNYGHPAPELLNRLEAQSIDTLRTDRRGAVKLEIRNREIFVMPYRKDNYG